MLHIPDPNQIALEAFKTPFEIKMNPKNRWVQLAHLIPWGELTNIYAKSMSDNFGRPGINSRIVIGSIIIKVILDISDEETLDQIRENIYMQYFLGYPGYRDEYPFDASLFVYIRERMGQELVDEMNTVIIKQGMQFREKKSRKKKASDKQGPKGRTPAATNEDEKGTTEAQAKTPEETMVLFEKETEVSEEEQAPGHSGSLILDATISDQYIKYPNDVELLQDSREKSEGIIDYLHEESLEKKKPRTYRQKARKQFLNFAKKKKRNRQAIHKAKGQQMRYLRRNFKTIERMLDSYEGKPFPLTEQMLKDYWVIQEIYRQQKQMYERKENRCDDRVVSILQPYVRPMVRGKQGKDVEFGSKSLVGLVGGEYAQMEKMQWDGFNEGSLVMQSVQKYRKTFGYYPEVVIGDRIFITRENKKNLDAIGVRLSGKQLGRKAEGQIREEEKQMIKDQKNRVLVEGKFGQGKNAYGLNQIRMRTKRTSESMIMSIYFVMNLVRLAKQVLFWTFLQIDIVLHLIGNWITYWLEAECLMDNPSVSMKL